MRMLVCIMLVSPLLLLGSAAMAVLAQDKRAEPVPWNVHAEDHLKAAREHLERGRWELALSICQKLLHSFGPDLVPSPDDPVHLVSARLLAQDLLHHLPAEGLVRYRRDADAIARQFLAQSIDSHEVASLQELTDIFACTAMGGQALDRLGDLLYMEGRFFEAEAAWQRASAVPEPRPERARLQAKRLLARLHAGRRSAYHDALRTFSQEFGSATGTLAGRTGTYLSILQAAESEGISEPAPKAGQRGVRPWVHERRRLREPRCTVALPEIRSPIVLLGHHAVYLDGDGIQALHVTTGLQRTWLRRDVHGGKVQFTGQACSLAPDGRRLYCCLPGAGREGAASPKVLMCLDGDHEGQKLWELDAATLGGEGAEFSASPLPAGEVLYVGLHRPAESRSDEVLCLHALNGAVVWQSKVLDHSPPSRLQDLVLVGRHVVGVDSLGAICALDRGTGKHRWGRLGDVAQGDGGLGQERNRADGLERKPSRCLHAEGRLYVASPTLGRLISLDAVTGRLVWQVWGCDIHSIIGMADGRLICLAARDVRALDCDTGQPCWRQSFVTPLQDYGRCVLAGDWILCSTPGGFVVLSTRDGKPILDPQLLALLPEGQVLLADHTLVIGGRRKAYLFDLPE